MNKQMNLPALQRIAMEFEKENDMMDQRQEMMDDAVDEAMGAEDEDESDEVVNQVMDELGIDLGAAVSMATALFFLRDTDGATARGNSQWDSEGCGARRASGTGGWRGRSRRRRPTSSSGQPEAVRVRHIQMMMRWRCGVWGISICSLIGIRRVQSRGHGIAQKSPHGGYSFTASRRMRLRTWT